MSHGFANIAIGDEDYYPRNESFIGQSNGLLGTACDTFLALTFGLHTGNVSIRLELHLSPPSLDQQWEEIVEASFYVPDGEQLTLVGWDNAPSTFSLSEGWQRARYCAKRFGEGGQSSAKIQDEQYLLCFWAEDNRADQVIKVTRAGARYWHDVRPRS